MAKLVKQPSCHFQSLESFFFSYLLRCCIRTYDAWFPRYALGNGLMFFCRVFSPAVGRGSSALSTFLDRRTQRVKEGKRKLARKFNLSYRYIDDFISFTNKRFKEFISKIYPKELTISETTESTSVASYLDLLFI